MSIGFVRPESLSEAVEFLTAHGSETEILAGGTDVMVDLRNGEIRAKYLLDVSRLDALHGIEQIPEGLSVGAAVTLNEIHASTILKRYAPALQKCAATFASSQIRNVATIGGNVAHCSPCGDTLPPLVIHEAEAVLASENGSRRVPVEAIASGPYACALPAGEIIVRFILKPAHGITFSDFQKIGRRRSLAIARISMAAMVRQKEDQTINWIRLALGACTPTPCRLTRVETYLTDKMPTAEHLITAAGMVAEEMIAITGRRHSTRYKEPAVKGLFIRLFHSLV